MSAQSYVVRDAAPADIPAMIAMKRKLAAIEGSEATLRTNEQDWRRQCFGPQRRLTALIAEQDGSAVGMIIYGEIYYAGWPEPALHVCDVFVEPQCRRQGIGRALFGRVAARAGALQSPMLELEVRTDNPARKFYRACGFERVRHCMTYVASAAVIQELMQQWEPVASLLANAG